MELARLDKVKSNLTLELTRLSTEAEKYETLTLEHEELQKLYQETEGKYQTMLTVITSCIYVKKISLKSSNVYQYLGR